MALLLFGCAARVTSPQVAATKAFEPEAITRDLAAVVERYGAPGLAVAVIADDKIVYDRGFGYRDLATRSPVTSETQFGIGSIVKSFTSGLFGQLEAEGLVSLDANPAVYVPELVFRDPDLTTDLTLRHLLSQTSGLPDLAGSTAFFPEPDQAGLAPRLEHFAAGCRVGTCWRYNNLNFTTLDMVAEAVTGQSKSQLLEDRLLKPLAMTGSTSSTATFEQSPQAAVGYGMREGDAVPVACEYLFGEQIYATGTDLARWLGAWMDARTEEGRVLPAGYAVQATSMQAIENGAPPEPGSPHIYLFGYGYGWQIKSIEGHYVVHHGGNENGFSAHVLFIPASGIGMVALTNQQDSLLPNVATDLLMRAWLDLPRTDVGAYPVVVSELDRGNGQAGLQTLWKPDEPMTVDVDAVLGTYEAVGYGRIQVSRSDDTLLFTTPLGDLVLVHHGGNRFGTGSVTPPSAGVNLDFFEVVFADDGTLTFNIAAEPVVFSRSDSL